uniref:(northern house mosquito) hypothetical protein n=1 Tax=Culex pipiens TaxID=7175 RepID=A0A8D8ERJ8_CULPI
MWRLAALLLPGGRPEHKNRRRRNLDGGPGRYDCPQHAHNDHEICQKQGLRQPRPDAESVLVGERGLQADPDAGPPPDPHRPEADQLFALWWCRHSPRTLRQSSVAQQDLE